VKIGVLWYNTCLFDYEEHNDDYKSQDDSEKNKKKTKKDADTRLRLLLVEQILRGVGEGEYITTKEIQKILKERYNIDCEVKAIYGDVKAINEARDKLEDYRNKMVKKNEIYHVIEVPDEAGLVIEKHQRRGYSVFDYSWLDASAASYLIDCIRTSPLRLTEEEEAEMEERVRSLCDTRTKLRLEVGKQVAPYSEWRKINYRIVQKIETAVVDEDIGYKDGKVFKMKMYVGEQETEIVPLEMIMAEDGVLWLEYYDCEAKKTDEIPLEQVADVVEMDEIVDYEYSWW